MSNTIALILIITSTVTFIASSILMYYNKRLGLPTGEWVAFIFISFLISASQVIRQFNPPFDINSAFLLIIISVTIFVLVVINYWEMFTEYSF